MSRSSPAGALAGNALARARAAPLLPCPFCGGRAFSHVLGSGSIARTLEGMTPRMRVGCSNKRCAVKPCIEIVGRQFSKPAPWLYKAVKQWNRRKPA